MGDVEILTVRDIEEMQNKLKAKRMSRIWFDPDVELLNSLCEAEGALQNVMGLLAIEGLPRQES